MSELVDIPERSSKDGTAQLVTLRSYLKDSGDVKIYPDTLLIDLLVLKTPIEIWQEFVGAEITDVPFTYTQLDMTNHITRVRMLTGDTVEDSLLYTDVEILCYLKFLPLRYLISCINAKIEDRISNPEDVHDPIHILRKYLEDEGGEKFTDSDLVDQMFRNRVNPFGIILNLMERESSATSASTSLNSGQSLASIDGITFGAPLEETSLEQQGRDTVAEHAARSVYERDTHFGMYEDGENLAKIDWESRWYAIH